MLKSCSFIFPVSSRPGSQEFAKCRQRGLSDHNGPEHFTGSAGASADCYFMAGKSRSSVAPPCPLQVNILAACAKQQTLQVSFTVLLSNSVQELQSSAAQTINAVGAIDSTGALKKHPGSVRAPLHLRVTHCGSITSSSSLPFSPAFTPTTHSS